MLIGGDECMDSSDKRTAYLAEIIYKYMVGNQAAMTYNGAARSGEGSRVFTLARV